MPRINLLRRKLIKKRVRVQKDFVDVYSIAKTVNSDRYFLHDIDIEANSLLWTIDRGEAIEFYSQPSVEDFISEHLGSRKGIYIVNRKEQVDTIVLVKKNKK